jgi:hypothetical protein
LFTCLGAYLRGGPYAPSLCSCHSAPRHVDFPRPFFLGRINDERIAVSHCALWFRPPGRALSAVIPRTVHRSQNTGCRLVFPKVSPRRCGRDGILRSAGCVILRHSSGVVERAFSLTAASARLLPAGDFVSPAPARVGLLARASVRPDSHLSAGSDAEAQSVAKVRGTVDLEGRRSELESSRARGSTLSGLPWPLVRCPTNPR